MYKQDKRKQFRDFISNKIKNGAVKTALSWIATKAAWATTGPLGWLATLILGEIWDYVGDKFVKWALRKGALVYDKADGSIKAKKIKKARQNADSNYDDAVDDVFK